jgi:hypothetical protein
MLVKFFNDAYPVGTPIEYWPGAREGEGKKSVTSSAAQLLGGHTPVVWVEGHAACISLTHVHVNPIAG